MNTSRLAAQLSSLVVATVLVACRADNVAGPAGTSPSLALAAFTNGPPCPSGWATTTATKGVSVCRRTTSRGGRSAADYAIQLDLSAGARLLQISEPKSLASSSNPSPLFTRYTVSSWWSRYSTLSRKTCFVNGSFFTKDLPGTTTTEMSFPLKGEGNLYSRGAEYSSSLSKNVLKVDGTTARIEGWTFRTSSFTTVQTALSNARLAVVGATPYLSDASYDGRTFVGTRDANGDGKSEVIVFLVSTRARPVDMNNMLSVNFKATNALAFDGGDSSQLRCSDGTALSWRTVPRTVPQVFAVILAP